MVEVPEVRDRSRAPADRISSDVKMVRRIQIAGVTAAIAIVTALHYLTPSTWPLAHNVLQHLYVVPIVIAGIYFGWLGSLVAAALAGVCYAPHVAATVAAGVPPGYLSGQVAEFADFLLAGVLAGVLAARERRQKEALEGTTRKLAEVYRELQENFDRMKRAERLYALGQLSAGLAHEIRNPLSAIAGAAGILKRAQSSSDRQSECVSIIDKECQRLDSLLVNFLEFARPRAPRYQSVDIAALFDSVAALSAHGIGQNKVGVRKEIAAGLPELHSDAEQLKQVLLNLLINAIQAMPEGGEVVLSCRRQAGRILMQVRDQGCGIPAEHIDRVFDPFFTTKENGTGLGLSVAHQIVGQLGGMLTLEANAGRGMTFSIQLPAGSRETR
jgi:two-component system sensor histidine kinase HydH